MRIKLLTLLLLVLTGPVALAQKTEKATQTTTKTEGNQRFEGNYTSTENPEGVLIYTQGGKLMGKIPNQPSFALEHAHENTYNTSVGLILHFDPQHKQLIVEKDRKRQVLVKP